MASCLQIITKIKRHNEPTVEDVDDICDRIFKLVDKNKDSKWKYEENHSFFISFPADRIWTIIMKKEKVL